METSAGRGVEVVFKRTGPKELGRGGGGVKDLSSVARNGNNVVFKSPGLSNQLQVPQVINHIVVCGSFSPIKWSPLHLAPGTGSGAH